MSILRHRRQSTRATPETPATAQSQRGAQPREPSAYRRALAVPGARVFFLAAALARVGIAMTGLGLVWLVHSSTGSYAVAGLVTGAFALAEAGVGPQVARLVDRHGQTRVLPALLGAHGGAVVLLVVLAALHCPAALLVGSGVLAGGTIPQVGALSTPPPAGPTSWPAGRC